MGELVREHAEAAILRLDGVVAEPEAGVADLGAAEQDVLAADSRTGLAEVERVDVPAVGPDGVRALCATTGILALTGVDRLEVVDVAIGLVEVAIGVEVAIPDVELGKVVVDLLVRHRRARGLEPGVARSSMNCQAPPKSSTELSPYVDALPGTVTQLLTSPASV